MIWPSRRYSTRNGEKSCEGGLETQRDAPSQVPHRWFRCSERGSEEGQNRCMVIRRWQSLAPPWPISQQPWRIRFDYLTILLGKRDGTFVSSSTESILDFGRKDNPVQDIVVCVFPEFLYFMVWRITLSLFTPSVFSHSMLYILNRKYRGRDSFAPIISISLPHEECLAHRQSPWNPFLFSA